MWEKTKPWRTRSQTPSLQMPGRGTQSNEVAGLLMSMRGKTPKDIVSKETWRTQIICWGRILRFWPYGKGGMEVNRRVDVPYNVHIQWTLQYFDRRFRLHPQFLFQAFGVLQKRQVCVSACLQVQRKSFIRHQDAFRSLKPHDLMVASAEEKRKVPFSNPTVKALRGQLSALRTKVMGTDESRIRLRGMIEGIKVMKGPPWLWMTINQSVTGDPFALVLA